MPHQSWKERFIESAANWMGTTHGSKGATGVRLTSESLDEAVSDRRPRADADETETELFWAAFRMYVGHIVFERAEDFRWAWERESPIERAMLGALLVAARQHGPSVAFVLPGVNGKIRLGEDETGHDLTIEPQAELGEYRVDFLLTYQEVAPDFSVREKLPKPIHGVKEIPGTKIERRMMVIECDGHDFHDRTKEQARRDPERDRWLQTLGYKVFRYTGSEIWADVFKAADQAVLALLEFSEE